MDDYTDLSKPAGEDYSDLASGTGDFESLLQRSQPAIKDFASSGLPGWIAGGTMRMSPLDKTKTLLKTAEGPIGNVVSNVLDRPGAFAMGGVPGSQLASSAGAIPGLWNMASSFLPGLNMPKANVPFEQTTGFSEAMSPSTPEAQLISNLGNMSGMGVGAYNPELVAGGFLKGAKAATAPARGIARFFSTKPYREQLKQLPIKTGEEIAAVESQYGSSPYIKGEGKIGKELAAREGLSAEARNVRQKYSSELGLRKEAASSVSGTAKQKMNQIRNEIKTSANELAYTGKEEANTALKSKLKQFHEMYDEGLSEAAGEGITRAELSQSLRNASSRMGLGSRKMLSGDEATLKGLANEILPPKIKGESISKYTKRANAKLKPEDVKAFFKNIRGRMSTTDHPISEIYREVGDLVSNKMPKYAALKDEYKPIYETIRNTKKLMSEGAIRGYTQPTVSPTKLAQAQNLEKELGINITGKAKNIASKRAEIAKEFKVRVDDLREIKNKQLEDIYSKISKSKDTQSRLIHEMRNKVSAIKDRGDSSKNFLESEIKKRNFRKGIAATLITASGIGSGVIRAIRGKQ